MINIYVGNLPFRATEAELMDLFAEHGEVERANIIVDRQTGRSRGYGFVEMKNRDEGLAAIEALNGMDFSGRSLTVNEARARTDSGSGGRRYR